MHTPDACMATIEGSEPKVTVSMGTTVLAIGEYVLRCNFCKTAFVGQSDSSECIYCQNQSLQPMICRI